MQRQILKRKNKFINAIIKSVRSGNSTQCKVQQFILATPNSDSCTSNLYYKNRTCSVFKRDQRRARFVAVPRVPDSGTKCQQQAQLTEITTSNCIKDAPACTSPKWMSSWAPNGAMRARARWWTCLPPRWTLFAGVR